MNKDQTKAKILEVGLIPIVRAASAEDAFKAAEAIIAGGVGIAEITMTVPGAIRVMEKVADRYGDKVLLGAGTILDTQTARAALLAGAEFLVSPSLNLGVIETANRYSKACLPGALTPTEVVTAWQAGATFVKIFPCGAVGGAKYIKALKGPLPQVAMVPETESPGDCLYSAAVERRITRVIVIGLDTISTLGRSSTTTSLW